MTPEIKERIAQIQRGEVPAGYRDTDLGIIPEEWECRMLSDICTVNPSKSKNIPDAVTFLGMTDVSEDGKILNQTLMDSKKVNTGLTPFKKGDILVAKITPCFENGKGAFTNTLLTEYGFGSTEFHVLRTRECSKFIFYITQTSSFRKKLESEMTGSAGQKRVQSASLKRYLVGKPPIEEQQKIAEILTTQDKVIELKEQRIAEKQRQKKYLMQQLLTGKTRLPGCTGEWKVIPANQIFKSISNKRHDGKLEVLSATQDKGIVPRSQVDIDIKYDKNSLGTYKKVEAGNFVISLRSFQGGIEYSEYTGIVSPAYTVLAPIVDIHDGYYKAYFKSPDYIQRLNIAVYGIRDGKQISYEDFGRITIPYPPLEEQSAIASVLTTADKELDLLKQNLEQEKLKKKALMQLLLTGIVRV